MMNYSLILQTCLILHLTGLTLMAGTTVVDFIIFNNFYQKFETEKDKALAYLEIMPKLSILTIAGGILLIFSGTALFSVTQGVFAEQFWFRLKGCLILLIILNGIFWGGKQGTILKNIIKENGQDLYHKVNSVALKLRLFYVIQATLFFLIIILAIFKFN